ncbi:protein downstream neighbor of Son-like [Watersipora subatra]|uniref:protein downstream neighbor of Son-like n=1 Tax=Watersipora subatra TaxID=2589382 RepID=UPI00355B10F7
MSKDEPPQLTSPDFKRITGKLRVIKRRKRPDAVSDSAVLSSPIESSVSKQRVRGRNPFRSLPANGDADRVTARSALSAASPAADSDSLDSDCFIPRTPEKVEQWPVADTTGNSEMFIIPSSPDYSPRRKLKRRQLASLDYKSIPEHAAAANSESPARPQSSATVVDKVIRDYSLCTKLRLTSRFDFCSLVAASGDVHSQALDDFMTGRPCQNPHVALHRHLHCYVYPNMPWLRLFPRTSNKKASQALPLKASSALDIQWKETYTSVYASLVSGHLSCHYFYALCEGFTLLFHRCTECKTIRAVVYPTTRGFRQKLQERGIDFTLPLEDERRKVLTKEKKLRNTPITESEATPAFVHSASSKTGHELSIAEDDPNTSLTEGEVNDPLEWLEDIGLEKSHFPSLRPSKVQMEEESFKNIDYRPASTVLISGQMFVDRLVDFTRNYNKTIASTGELASIPPTILSRSPFLGATIQKLELRSGWMTSDGGEKLSYIDLERPLLTGVIDDIMKDVVEPGVTSGEAVAVSMQLVDDTEVFNVIKCADSSCSGSVPAVSHDIKPQTSFMYKNHQYYY